MDRHDEFDQANRRAREFDASHPKTVSARFDPGSGKIVLHLSNGKDFDFPPNEAQGLEHATPAQLSPIEISPSGFGIYFPKLDADLYVPSLLEGIFGSKKWTAARKVTEAADTNAPTPRARIKAAV